MADQRLPLVPTIPHYEVATQLGDDLFILELRWNARDEAWYMGVFDDAGTAIRVGIKIVLGTLLGGRVRAAGFPDGVLQAVDLTGAGLDAALDDLGTRVAVYFTPRADL